MTRHRYIALLFALLASVALAASTSGVSSIAADRGIQAQIVEDENAYLGFETETRDTADGTTDLNVTVANQFLPGTTLRSVLVTVNGTTKDLTSIGSLDPGESATRSFENVPCGAALTVEAQGSGVKVFLERTVVC